MEKKMEMRINYLTAYAVISSLVLGAILFSSFDKKRNLESFDEITAKRINIIGEDGSLRLVFSNETRQHPGRINGKDLEKRERPSGILFFNTEGDECGGIIQYANSENGETNSGMSFTMDQYKEDQVLQIINSEYYAEGKEKISRGLLISDFPTGSDLLSRMKKIKDIQDSMRSMNEEDRNALIAKYGNSLSSKQRLFIGKTKTNDAGLYLSGPDGKQKLKIYVDDKGIPRFDVMDENGQSKNILEKK